MAFPPALPASEPLAPGKTDWKQSTPMPGPRWMVKHPQRFSAENLAALRSGLAPGTTDARYAIWLDDSNVLRCWQNATGACIYEAPLTPFGDGADMQYFDVVDTAAVYSRSSADETERLRFEGVLHSLLGRTGRRGRAT